MTIQTFHQNLAQIAREKAAFTRYCETHPTTSPIELDRKLRDLCGYDKASYSAARATILTDDADYQTIIIRYQAAISARKEINRREGHKRARAIARAKHPFKFDKIPF